MKHKFFIKIILFGILITNFGFVINAQQTPPRDFSKETARAVAGLDKRCGDL